MTEEEKTESVSSRCAECGGGYRNHRVLFEQKKSYDDGDGSWDHDEYHQLIECMGCETIKYRQFSIGPYFNQDRGKCKPYDEHIYPNGEAEHEKHKVKDFGEERTCIPENVWKMYKETVTCINAKARTLAGGGLRATVEAICREQGITDGNLEKKIDNLKTKGLLSESEANLLHEERYIGNAALHEMDTPNDEDVEDGVTIVEGLLSTIYVLPAKAERLKKRRESKGGKRKS